MSSTPEPSWSDKNFGSDAPALRETIRLALQDACVQSQNAQDASGSEYLDPFGHALKGLQFQVLADRARTLLPKQHRIEKLDRYSLVIVNSFVLYPIRSTNPRSSEAKKGSVRTPVSKLRRRLFDALGPEPHQPPLSPEWDEDDAKDLRTLIARLGEASRLAAISYVCSYQAGLSDIHLGEAELNFRDGSLSFHRGENLSVLGTQGRAGTNLHPVGASSGAGTPAFDSGEPSVFDLEANRSHQTPTSEPEPPQPRSDNDAG